MLKCWISVNTRWDFFYTLKVDFSILFFTVCHTHCISGCSTFNVMNDEVNDNLISNLSLSFICLSTTYTSCARFPDKVLQSLSEVEALSQIVPRRKFGWHVDQISKWYNVTVNISGTCILAWNVAFFGDGGEYFVLFIPNHHNTTILIHVCSYSCI